MLIGDEPGSNICARPGRNNSLTAVTLVAAGEAVDLEGGPRTTLLDRSKAAFAKQFRHAEEFLVLAGLERQSGHFFSFESRERSDLIVEPRDGDATIFVP